MAVEIIEQGQLPEAKEYVVRCRNCQTKFKFTQADAIKHRPYDVRDPDYLSVACPLCYKSVDTPI